MASHGMRTILARHGLQASMKDVLMLLDDKASSEQIAHSLGDLQVPPRPLAAALCLAMAMRRMGDARQQRPDGASRHSHATGARASIATLARVGWRRRRRRRCRST